MEWAVSIAALFDTNVPDDDADEPSEHGRIQQRGSIDELFLRHMKTELTVLTRGVGGAVLILLLVVLVELCLLKDLIEKIVEKLVRILVHGTIEVLISIAKLVDKGTGCNNALICQILGDVHIERLEGGEEGRGH